MLSRWDKLARSGLVTVLGLLLVLAVLGTLWMAHLQGRIHKLTTTQEVPEQPVTTLRPGGQDLVHLNRFEVAGSMVPQFTAATLAPGYGMMMLEATLSLPGRGDWQILQGTRQADAGEAGGRLLGAEFSALVENREGPRWSTPVEIIAGQPARQQNTAVLPGGSRSEARFAPDVALPEGTAARTGVEAAVMVSMTSRGMDVDMSAKNTSPALRAVTLCWLPRFLAPQTGMAGMSVLPPQQSSGREAQGSVQSLGIRDVDQTFTAPHTYLSAGPEVLLQNQPDSYALRFTALTPSIRSVHVKAGAHDASVLVAFSTAANAGSDADRTVLAPGETLHWRLRIEAVPISPPTTQAP